MAAAPMCSSMAAMATVRDCWATGCARKGLCRFPQPRRGVFTGVEQKRGTAWQASPGIASIAMGKTCTGDSTVCRGTRTRQRSRMGSLSAPMRLSAFAGLGILRHASVSVTGPQGWSLAPRRVLLLDATEIPRQ
jgi:hypothetical protein